jgi:hypothetical protein
MKLKIALKPFLLFSLGFIISIPIGTLSHEYGHILVAKYFGFETVLHHASVSYDDSAFVGDPSFHQLLISWGGPISTILVGSFSFFFLLRRDEELFYWEDWLFVFGSLFWLRMPINLLHSVLGELISPNGSYFGGDEQYISNILDLPAGFLPITFALLGLAISSFVIFRIMPKTYRNSFLLSGFIGGGFGYFFWMSWLGPILLP